jgi:serine-type D-Ala-D-Ala carboxypeptidase
MLASVPAPPDQVAVHVAESLVRATSDHGPSAVVVSVSEADGEPLTVTRGHARVLDDRGDPMSPVPLAAEPVFDVGSVTKVVVTTTLCMSLVEEDLLALTAPVSRWLPDFTGGGKEAVTVRDLLEHQAGLWEWWPTYLDGARTCQDALAVVQGLPLRYPARTGRHYSDLGFMLLGEIMARAYGEPLDAAARRRVFEPLGLNDTCYRGRDVAQPSERVVATSVGDWYERRMVRTGAPYPVPRCADSFTGWRRQTLVGEANDGNCWHAFGGVAGHAGLFTTATDLVRLGRALLVALEGNGPWSAEVVREFCSPGRDPGQALGFRVRQGVGGTVVEHPGFPGARFAVLPERRRVAVLLTNRLHTTQEPVGIDASWYELLGAVEKGRAA